MPVINPDVTAFAERELEEVAALQAKVRLCRQRGEQIHPRVYEFLRAETKSVNSEILAYDEGGRIFLNDRPVNNPDDPYAGIVALTGVTHRATESEEEALFRLVRTELEGLEIIKLSCPRVEEFRDPGFPRGRYVSFCREALVRGEPQSPGIRAFTRDRIPWNRLVFSSAWRIMRWLEKK